MSGFSVFRYDYNILCDVINVAIVIQTQLTTFFYNNKYLQSSRLQDFLTLSFETKKMSFKIVNPLIKQYGDNKRR